MERRRHLPVAIGDDAGRIDGDGENRIFSAEREGEESSLRGLIGSQSLTETNVRNIDRASWKSGLSEKQRRERALHSRPKAR